RTLAEAVTLADRSVFSALTTQLGKQHRSALDSLLISEGEQPSRLAWLLQPPGKINGKNVLQHIDRLNSITALELPDGIELSVHQNKLLKLAREGRKMSSRDLAKFTDIRRYATLVCVIQEARATLTDEVIELHERIMGGLFSQAKRKQAERLQLTGKLIQSKLRQYVTVGQALLHARKSGEDPWAAIEDVIPWQEFVNSLEETQLLSRKGNFDPLHLITEKYSTLRK
ncbi:TPA: Tn3 family transposase, partial [Escherichia coli]|nr:Tn3 family transposase [Escherichia coli]HEM0196190.1 Tn3 family transposase [Escherichia coli]